jgi:hypothetical protein
MWADKAHEVTSKSSVRRRDTDFEGGLSLARKI